MFTRRLKQRLARLCIALFCMQAVVAAYACPAFLSDIEPARVVALAHTDEKLMSGDCEQQRAASTAEKNMCHQHYAGNQSVGTVTLAAAAPPLPLMIVAAVAPVMPGASMVLPVLLQRNTAPPLSIQFQVLRI